MRGTSAPSTSCAMLTMVALLMSYCRDADTAAVTLTTTNRMLDHDQHHIHGLSVVTA